MARARLRDDTTSVTSCPETGHTQLHNKSPAMAPVMRHPISRVEDLRRLASSVRHNAQLHPRAALKSQVLS